jgi:hypothetical protein
MNNKDFKAERISKTAVITLDGKVETVFPLFGAFEERKWAKDWDPILIYPSAEKIEEGTTFKTKGNGHNEAEFVWRVSKYKTDKYLIQYLVTTENRYWTITIECCPLTENRTSAEITYTFIGLNELGNRINKQSLEHMYEHDLKDWEEAINLFLKNDK